MGFYRVQTRSGRGKDAALTGLGLAFGQKIASVSKEDNNQMELIQLVGVLIVIAGFAL